MPIPKLVGGSPSANRKINQSFDVCNAVLNMRGSGNIYVRYSKQGITIGDNKDQIISSGGSGSIGAGQYPGMFYGTQANNSNGFSFIFFHDDIT